MTYTRVPEGDLVEGQKLFMFFALDTAEKSEEMENFLFLMADDVPFTD